jgi:hypothetical protein
MAPREWFEKPQAAKNQPQAADLTPARARIA